MTMRFTSEPLPPYTYVPGKSPHPVSDPAGHHFGQPPPQVESFAPERWRSCYPYVRGLDLFHEGFYWEAHEQWEAVWLAVGRRGPVADVLKGLIKLAAAGVKQQEGKPVGVQRHARRAAELWAGARSTRSGSEATCGLELTAAVELAREVEHAGWIPGVQLPLESPEDG